MSMNQDFSFSLKVPVEVQLRLLYPIINPVCNVFNHIIDIPHMMFKQKLFY